MGQAYSNESWTAIYPVHYDKRRVQGLKFVICASARSGTGYAATIFEKLGISCGHEEIFGHSLTRSDRPVLGESSWLSLSALLELPPDIILLHQVRNPMKVLSSLIKKQMFVANGNEPLCPYGRFALANLGLPQEVYSTLIYLHYWTKWNLMIEHAGSFRPYMRYRVEDMSDLQTGILEKILWDAMGLSLQDCEEVRDALGHVPHDVNHYRGKAPSDIENLNLTIGNLPKVRETLDVYTLALRYGYSLEDLS